MKLHESKVIEYKTVAIAGALRVVGGWVYTIYGDDSVESSVFVPERDRELESLKKKVKEEVVEIKKRIREAEIEDVERAFVTQALSRNDWNVTKAAQDTRMQRQNFQALMRKYDIKPGDLRPK